LLAEDHHLLEIVFLLIGHRLKIQGQRLEVRVCIFRDEIVGGL